MRSRLARAHALSDHKEPNRYQPLRDTERQVEADRLAEQSPLEVAERHEQAKAEYAALLSEKVEKKRIPPHEVSYYLSRFENDAAFRSSAEAEVKEWTAHKTEETERSRTVDEKPGAELTESQAARMQRLRAYTQEAALDHDNEQSAEITHGGGRSR